MESNVSRIAKDSQSDNVARGVVQAAEGKMLRDASLNEWSKRWKWHKVRRQVWPIFQLYSKGGLKVSFAQAKSFMVFHYSAVWY